MNLLSVYIFLSNHEKEFKNMFTKVEIAQDHVTALTANGIKSSIKSTHHTIISIVTSSLFAW